VIKKNAKPATVAFTVKVPAEIWQALRRLSERRALEVGGRPSMSAAIATLVKAQEGGARG
jgi:hypothetical protein